MEKSITDTKMPARQRLAYAFGAFGNDVFYFALATYLINFITSHLIDTGNPDLNNTLVGAITLTIMGLRIVELLIDPFIGNAIDRTRTKWGHFRPWVVIGGVVSSVVLCILFTNMGGMVNPDSPSYNPWLYVVLFGVLYIIMDIFYSFRDIGFWSMLPAMTFDSREREKTATFARIGSTVGGSLVGVVLMPIVLYFSLDNSTGTGDNNGWFMFGFIVALTGIITALCVGIFTREKEDSLRENKKETKGIVAVLKILVKNDQLLWTAISYILYSVGLYVVNSLELYYFQYIMGVPEGFSIMQTINMFVGILSVGVFPVISKRFGRRNIFVVCFISLFLGLAIFAFGNLPQDQVTQMIVVLIAAELFFIPQPIVFLVILMTITDSVEYGQLKLGHRDESLILSVRPLCDKFGSAVSNGVVGQTAILAGMTAGASAASITTSGVFMFKIMMIAVPAVLLLISLIVYLTKVKLNEKMHAEILEKLNKTWNRKND